MFCRTRSYLSCTSSVRLSSIFVVVALTEHSERAVVKPGIIAVGLELPEDARSVVTHSAAAARIMRKDAGTVDGELEEHGATIGTQGHAVRMVGDSQWVPVEEHSLLKIAEDDDSFATPRRGRKQAAKQPRACDQCTVNVQIATTKSPALSEVAVLSQDAITPSVVHKTMKIQACVDKEKPEVGFYFSGCTTEGDAADICVHSQNEEGGVRILKDGNGHVVGYGSCCSVDLADHVSQVNVMQCVPSPKIGHGANSGAEKIEELTSQGEENHFTQDSIFGAAGSLKAPGEEILKHTWGGIWDAWPENATSVEESFVLLPRRLEIIIVLLVCSTISLAASGSSVWLMLAHLRFGSRITGSIFKLHPSSAAAIGLLWPIPLFSILGLVTLMLPELTVVWQFLEALLLSASLRKMPDLFLQSVGGQLCLELSHRSRSEAVQEALPIFTQWPFCCMRRCVRPKVPEVKDISRFHWVVVSLCLALPILSFSEMFMALEVVLGPPTTRIRFISISPVVMTIIRSLQAFCLALGMASVTGLEMVLTSLSPKAASVSLDCKSLYCQILLGGIRLLPLVCSIAPLWGFGPLLEGHGAAASRGAIVSVATVLCALIGWRAFPVDEFHYPSLAAASGTDSCESESVSCRQAGTTLMLDQVKYCPFCGFSELELEATQAMSESAVCPRCCAHNVPVHLVVRRGESSTPSKDVNTSNDDISES